MTARGLALIWALCIIGACAGCGSSTTQTPAAANPSLGAPSAAPAANLPAPATLRTALYSEATINRDGSSFLQAAPFPVSNVAASGNKALFNPNWLADGPNDPSGLAYCCYQFTADSYDRDPSIRFTWATAHDVSLFYVAVANFPANRWDMYAGPPSGSLTLTPEQFAASVDTNTSTMLVVPIVMGTDQWALTNVRLGEMPAPAITGVTPGGGNVGDVVSISAVLGAGSGPVTQWQWNFAGGATPNTSTNASPQITLGSAGTYNCTVRATNATAQVTFHFDLVVTVPPPAPNITAVAPIQGQPDAQLTLNATNTGGAVATWAWDFGGGATDNTSSDAAPQITLVSTPGQYAASVTASNVTGSSTFNFTLTVGDAPPNILLVNPKTGPATTFFGITALNNGGPVTTWAWDFGGGATPNTSSDQHPFVTLGAEGVYDASVTATNNGGSSTFPFTLTVTQQPGGVTVTDASPKTGTEGQDITLTPVYTGTPDTWAWDFGGAGTPNTSTDENPVLTLGVAGTYNCSVIATNAVNSSEFDFQIVVVSVNDPPLITGVSPTTGNQMDNFLIVPTFAGQVDTWEWTFTGALPGTSAAQTPHIVLASPPGVYPCSVIATNANGSFEYDFNITIAGGPPPPPPG